MPHAAAARMATRDRGAACYQRHLTRFHGVFAPNSKHRALVAPAKRGKGSKAEVSDEPPTPAEHR